MKSYVLGFFFDAKATCVLLIRKQRPEWQAGKLNGIGGKIEKDETPHNAMVRECQEETGLSTSAKQWHAFAKILFGASGEEVACFYTSDNLVASAHQTTDEELIHVSLGKPCGLPLVHNVGWLVEDGARASQIRRGEPPRNPGGPMKATNDPEVQMQRDELAGEGALIVVAMFCLLVTAAFFAWLGSWPVRAWRWLHWRRECCWCNPPHRIGGNPFAKRVTHTACTLGQNNFWHRSPKVFGARRAATVEDRRDPRAAAASPDSSGRE